MGELCRAIPKRVLLEVEEGSFSIEGFARVFSLLVDVVGVALEMLKPGKLMVGMVVI